VLSPISTVANAKPITLRVTQLKVQLLHFPLVQSDDIEFLGDDQIAFPSILVSELLEELSVIGTHPMVFLTCVQ